MQSKKAIEWLELALKSDGWILLPRASEAVVIAETEAEQRAVAAAARMCPYRIGKGCNDNNGQPCDHKCQVISEFLADMRSFQNADHWVTDDELSLKVAGINARIDALRHTARKGQKQPHTPMLPDPAPGSWSERE